MNLRRKKETSVEVLVMAEEISALNPLKRSFPPAALRKYFVFFNANVMRNY